MKKIAFIIIGIVSIALSITCYTMDEDYYAYEQRYGGDAYTGIQNAAAQTAKNVLCLTKIERFGVGSMLLVAGLSLIVVGIPERKK